MLACAKGRLRGEVGDPALQRWPWLDTCLFRLRLGISSFRMVSQHIAWHFWGFLSRSAAGGSAQHLWLARCKTSAVALGDSFSLLQCVETACLQEGAQRHQLSQDRHQEEARFLMLLCVAESLPIAGIVSRQNLSPSIANSNGVTPHGSLRSIRKEVC